MLSLHNIISSVKKLAFSDVSRKPYNLSKTALDNTVPQRDPDNFQPTENANIDTNVNNGNVNKTQPITPGQPVQKQYKSPIHDLLMEFIANNTTRIDPEEGANYLMSPDLWLTIQNNPAQMKYFQNLVNQQLGTSSNQFIQAVVEANQKAWSGSFLKQNLLEQEKQDKPIASYAPSKWDTKLILDATNLISKPVFERLRQSVENIAGANANEVWSETIQYAFGAPRLNKSKKSYNTDQRLNFFNKNTDKIPTALQDMPYELLVKQNQSSLPLAERDMLFEQLDNLINNEDEKILLWITGHINKFGLKTVLGQLTQKGVFSIDSVVGENGESQADNMSSDITQGKDFREDDSVVQELFEKYFQKVGGYIIYNYLGDIINEMAKIKNLIVEKMYKSGYQSDTNMGERLDIYVDEALKQFENIFINQEQHQFKSRKTSNGAVYQNQFGAIEIPRDVINNVIAYIKTRVLEDNKDINPTDTEVIYDKSNIDKYTKEYLNSFGTKGEQIDSWSPDWTKFYNITALSDKFNQVGEIKATIVDMKKQGMLSPSDIMSRIGKDLEVLFGNDEKKKIEFVTRTLNQDEKYINQLRYAGNINKKWYKDRGVEDTQNKRDKGGIVDVKNQFGTNVVHFMRQFYPQKDDFSIAARKGFFSTLVKPHPSYTRRGDNALGSAKSGITGIDTNTDLYYAVTGVSDNDVILKKINDVKNKYNTLVKNKNNPENQDIESVNRQLEFYEKVINEAWEYYSAKDRLPARRRRLENKKQEIADGLGNDFPKYRTVKDDNGKAILDENGRPLKRQITNIEEQNEMQSDVSRLEKIIDDYGKSDYNISKIANKTAIRMLLGMLNKTKSKIAYLSNIQIKLAKVSSQNDIIGKMITYEINKFHDYFFNMLD